jgi:hypothetical protein
MPPKLASLLAIGLAPLLMAQTSGRLPTYPGKQVNAFQFGVRCDGVSDDYAAFVRAIAQVPAGGTLYIPPSSTACLISQNLAPAVSMTIYASPGTATLKPAAGNVANPVLLSVNTLSTVSINGLTFDGGGTAFSNTNSVITVFASSNVNFNHITVQNTRGVGLLVSTSSSTGVRNSTFSNIGMHWATSLLAADRHQAVAFCCSTSSKNYAINNYFTNIGLDSVSATGQSDFIAQNNRCALSTAQTAQAFVDWPACVYASGNKKISIIGNVSNSAPGNGIDVATATSNAVITGNFVTGSGGSGIALAGVANFAVSDNVAIGNGLHTTSCQRSGIDLVDVLTRGTISANILASNAQYGIFAFTACGHPATLTDVITDSSNSVVGNTAGTYGGAISGPSIARVRKAPAR